MLRQLAGRPVKRGQRHCIAQRKLRHCTPCHPSVWDRQYDGVMPRRFGDPNDQELQASEFLATGSEQGIPDHPRCKRIRHG